MHGPRAPVFLVHSDTTILNDALYIIVGCQGYLWLLIANMKTAGHGKVRTLITTFEIL